MAEENGFSIEQEIESVKNELPLKTIKSNKVAKGLSYLAFFFILAIITMSLSSLIKKYVTSDTVYNQLDVSTLLVLPDENFKDLKAIEFPGFSILLDDERTYLSTNKLFLAINPENEELENEIQTKKFLIQDAILSVVSAKEYQEINTANARNTKLKHDILLSLNRLLASGSIDDLFWGENVSFITSTQ